MKIAILGAEGTGKTYLAQALTQALTDSTAHFVLTDTSALMTAIDCALRLDAPAPPPAALAHQHVNDLVLVMGLDLPWLADTSDRDRLLKRSRVDICLRQVLQAAKLNYVVIYGQGAARTDCALQAIAHHAGLPLKQLRPASPWQWNCDKCSDGACEHRMFTGRLKLGSA